MSSILLINNSLFLSLLLLSKKPSSLESVSGGSPWAFVAYVSATVVLCFGVLFFAAYIQCREDFKDCFRYYSSFFCQRLKLEKDYLLFRYRKHKYYLKKEFSK